MAKSDKYLTQEIIEDMEVALREQHYEVDLGSNEYEKQCEQFCINYIKDELNITYKEAEGIYFSSDIYS